MATRELIFDIFAIDRASKVLSKVGTESEAMGGKTVKASKVISAGLTTATAVIIGAGVESVKTAADMETAMTRLTSTAGESVSNLGMIHAGIDQLAGKVGYTVTQLADAMYYVESGGYHGAKGLEVLTAAAKAAKVENANVTEVAHALTGVLNDYRGTGLSTAAATNTLTAAVGHGMMTFQDFAEALPKIGARAAATHITFQELTAAMATMTQDGLPAAVGATYLGQTIGQLAAPSAKAAKEMRGLGIDSTELAATITSGSGHGLGDALKMLYDGIANHLSPAGLVAVATFKKSKGSATDYQKMLANLPPTMQTIVQALAVMTGGVKSFQGVLMLGGKNRQAYLDNLKAMNHQVKVGGHDIAGYAEQQRTLNGQLADAKGAFSAAADQIGTKMLPAVTSWAQKLVPLTGFLVDHQAVLGRIAVVLLAAKAATVAYTAVQWLLNIALDANPIGLVIIAIGALIAVIVTAYKHSETFRNIVSKLFDSLKIGFLQIALVGVTCLKFLMDVWLTVVGALLNGAAKAFGWVPGLGPKLRGAADTFNRFKDSANAAMDHIKNNIQVQINTTYAKMAYDQLVQHMSKPVTIPVFLSAHYTAGTVNVAGLGKVNAGMRAGGGPVRAGQPYIVGEHEPELFVPGQSGMILNGRQMAGAGGSTVVINVNGATIGTPDGIAREIQQALLRYKRSNGAALGLA